MTDNPTLDPLRRMLHPIMGCRWGWQVTMPDDTEQCWATAVQRVALHPVPGHPEHTVVQLCQDHFDKLLALTEPTKEVPDDDVQR